MPAQPRRRTCGIARTSFHLVTRSMDTVTDFPTASSSYLLRVKSAKGSLQNTQPRLQTPLGYVTLSLHDPQHASSRCTSHGLFRLDPVSSRRNVHTRASHELSISHWLGGRRASSAHRLGVR